MRTSDSVFMAGFPCSAKVFPIPHSAHANVFLVLQNQFGTGTGYIDAD